VKELTLAFVLVGCAHADVPKAVPTAGPKTTFTIDLTQTKPISPYIYGANFPEWDKIGVPFPLARQGGNRLTAYNWTNNASNAGSDYNHQNDGYMGESNEAGLSVRTFMQGAENHGASAVLLTLQTAGYVAADKQGDGDVNKTPNYLEKRFRPVLPSKPGKNYIYPPSQTGPVYMDEFAYWINGVKKPGTKLFLDLDNEPDLWQETHKRIVPKNVGYAGIVANNIAFAKAAKQAVPNALVFGPASYGWGGYTTFQGTTDANSRDFLEFYLAEMKGAEQKTGHRLLDALDIHWYPEAKGGGKRITDGDGPESDEARIQAPRSLWDDAYVEDSWIADNLGHKPIRLIPRVMEKIDSQYPGTRLCMGEYNFGGGTRQSGLVAQADVLGLFGRYGVFAACNWGISPKDIAEISGYRTYLNFDGKGSQVGNQSVKVTGGSAEKSSVYVFSTEGKKGKVQAVMINKLGSAQMFDLDFGTHIANATAYLQTPTGTTSVSVEVSGSHISVNLPAYGVVTLQASMG